MREKFIIFIVGLLLGAIISTGSIYLYTVANGANNNNQNMQMNGGNPPSMPNGENNQNGGPPAMPNGETPGNQTSTN